MIKINRKNRFKIERKKIIIDVIFLLIFIFCSIFSSKKIFSYISILFFIIYFLYLILFKQKFLIKYLSFVFIAIIAILGTAIIEFNNLYLVELKCYSEFAGSLPLLILSYWLLLIVCMYYDYNFAVETSEIKFNVINKKSNKILKILTIFTLIIYLSLFIKVAKNPAFLLGVDRFQYLKIHNLSGIWSILTNISPILLIFPIISIIYGDKILGISTIFLYIIYFIWIGNKFGPFFTLISIFLLVSYKNILKKGKKFIVRCILITSIAFTIVLYFTVISVKLTSNYNGITYLLQRGAQQGQLWWKIYDLYNEDIHPFEFKNEINAIINNKSAVTENIGSNNGIYKAMYLCAPKKVIDFKLSTGSRYTEAGYAIIYYYFGAFGNIIFSLINGIIISLTINVFIKSINNKDYVKALIILRFFLIERIFLTMFVFNDLFDVVSILSYIYLIVMKRKKIKFEYYKGLSIKIIKY